MSFQDGKKEINRLLKFLDIELEEKLIKDIMEMCNFQKMAEEKERDEILNTYWNKDFQFFRKGKLCLFIYWYPIFLYTCILFC